VLEELLGGQAAPEADPVPSDDAAAPAPANGRVPAGVP
jgi:hypothetical protein